MSYCGPVCHVSCASSGGSCGLVPAYGSSSLSGAVSSYYAGGPITCSSQLTGSEVILQPPASVVTIPGPILSATTEPVAVGQVTPCSYSHPLSFVGGSSYGGYGRLGYSGYGSYGTWRRYSRRCLPNYCGPC